MVLIEVTRFLRHLNLVIFLFEISITVNIIVVCSPKSSKKKNFCFIFFIESYFCRFLSKYLLHIYSQNSAESNKKCGKLLSIFDQNNDILCSHAAVYDKVDRAVDNKEEMLDGGEGEHPAGVEGEHAQGPAHVCPLTHSRLYIC